MLKINTVWKLSATIGGLVILFLNVISYYRGDVMVLVAGNETANQYITPTIDWISQWTVIITAIIIICLIILTIVIYFINRRKKEKPSADIQAMENLTSELKRMNDRNERIDNEKSQNGDKL